MDIAVNDYRNEIRHTVQEIDSLPEGKRAEIIDGEWYNMAAPSFTHQRLIGGFYKQIREYIESNGGECVPVMAPFAVYIKDDDYNYLEPDVMVVCDKNKLDEKGCHGAPDLVAEVVSPSSRLMDYIHKLSVYQKAGVKEYWIIDPEKMITSIYFFEKLKDEGSFDLIQIGFDVPAYSMLYPGFAMKMDEELGE